MDGYNSWRRRALKFMATGFLGLTLFSLVSQSAESAPWRRGWGRGFGGYRAYRMPYRNFGRVYPGYGYGGGYGYGRGLGYGYGAVAPRYYSSNYFYGGAAPYGYGFGNYAAPVAPGASFYNFGVPMY